MKKNTTFSYIVNILPLIAIITIFCAAVYPQTSYQNAIEQSRKIISETMNQQKIPGLSIAVAVDGKIIWSEGFGFADLENQVRVSSQTRFRIASVSKLFTAAAIAKLYEQGNLDLNVPIQQYVQHFPRKEHDITARQLAGHLSGIRHYKRDKDQAKDEFFNRKDHYKTTNDALKFFENDPLDFIPETKFGYSSFGYTVLEAVIEGASGENFLSYMEKEVFEPLKMPNSTADNNQKIIPNRTRFYSLDENKNVINAPYVDYSISWAGGGFLSNSEDLVKFGSAHLQAGFLKESTLKEIFTSQKTSDGKETGTGLGWRIGKDKEERIYYFHPGEAVGGRSYLLMYPDRKVVVAILHNLTGAHLGSITAISKLFIED